MQNQPVFLRVYLNLKESSAYYLAPLIHATVLNEEIFSQVWYIFVTICRGNSAKVAGERYISLFFQAKFYNACHRECEECKCLQLSNVT